MMTEPPSLFSLGMTRFAKVRGDLENVVVRGRLASGCYEFLLFGFKQGWACLFGGLMLALLLCTHLYYPPGFILHRYDFLTLAAIGIQIAMLALRLETLREAWVICTFHVVGTIMELFKTSAGSWIYPEASLLHIGPVPMFSGFMYAAVGSYIARIWRIFDFRFTQYPPRWATILLAVAIYVNFFAHHWLPDVRIGLFAFALFLFRRTMVWFTPFRRPRAMPLLVGFFLVALFIWFGENIGTFAKAWTYPSQKDAWHMVSIGKLGSWYLLMIISFVLVSLIHAAPPSGASAKPAAA